MSEMRDSKTHDWRLVISWVLVVAWAAFIFFASAKSGLELDSGTGILSIVKRWLADVLSTLTGMPVDPSPIGHFAEYFVFGGLMLNAVACQLGVWEKPNSDVRAERQSDNKSKGTARRRSAPKTNGVAKACAIAVVAVAIYAVTDEIHQAFVPGRACDILDWLVDVAAASIAIIILSAIANRSQKA